jgi:hypothetical protein
VTTPGDALADREMNLRYAGKCSVCGVEIAKGAPAIYSPATHSVRHVDCKADVNVAGGSAQREYDRREQAFENRVDRETDNPQLAAAVREVYGPPSSTKSWATGAIGEERVGEALDALADLGVEVLHDRRVPGTKANVDHIAVSASGIWVIDTKRYQGAPKLTDRGRLYVGRFDQTRLADGVERQTRIVRAAIGDLAPKSIHGVLCFVDAEWPLIGGDFYVGSTWVCSPKKLASAVKKTPGFLGRVRLTTEEVEAVKEAIERNLPPA